MSSALAAQMSASLYSGAALVFCFFMFWVGSPLRSLCQLSYTVFVRFFKVFERAMEVVDVVYCHKPLGPGLVKYFVYYSVYRSFE